MIKLRPHQRDALKDLKNGSVLMGGVGSGKTITSLAYYYTKVCGGNLTTLGKPTSSLSSPLDIYVVTTARKRDSLDWENEAAYFGISTQRDASVNGVKLTVDSWNNVKNYVDITNAFFVFDEQRVVGSGTWAKAFIKISRGNQWIMLSATPGDTWMDYISVFIANGFYKNRTQFLREHVVYDRNTPYPKVSRYLNVHQLELLRSLILVKMDYTRETIPHHIDVIVEHEADQLQRVFKDRWNVFKDEPLINAGAAAYAMRQVVNSSPDRLRVILELAEKHKKLIVFYNFDYELETLRTLKSTDFEVAEYNGHYHEEIPDSEKWIYLVQYISGSEAWNCVETNAIAFYSLNYSYRITTQAAGRIDRMNTPFRNLYYYYLRSKSIIDDAIVSALRRKTNFNEKKFFRDNRVYF